MMTDLFVEFWAFTDANAVWVLIGTMLLGTSASVIGSFAFLRKRSLVGDVLAHSAIPGVMTAFILFQSNSPIAMFIGAILSSMLGLFFMNWLPKNTKIKPDAAMAITLSFFFSLGLMELSYIQGLEVSGKSGLDKMLFGQAAAMLPSDLYLLSFIAVVILTVVAIFFDKFRLISFNYGYAKTLGINMFFYEGILALLIVTSVVIGLQIVGVVLMAAVLLTPIATAKFWSSNLSTMLFIAAFIGAVSGLISANISYVAPAMPTGPWMVVVLSVFFILSFLFAPKRGLLFNFIKQHKLKLQINEENVLRTLYVLNERLPKNKNLKPSTASLDMANSFAIEDILRTRYIQLDTLKDSIKRLYKKGLLLGTESEIGLSKKGVNLATGLTRKHRLWEVYLALKADIDPKDVHYQAELVEHLLTEKQMKMIEKELRDQNLKDPHGKSIPAQIKGILNAK